MMLSSCSTSPSIIVAPDKLELPELVVEPSEQITTPCLPLVLYTSKDFREVIKVTIQNHNRFYFCSEKMKSAILYIENNR